MVDDAIIKNTMNYIVTIKQIDWIDQEAKEADVCFMLRDSLYWVFCHPCDFTEGEVCEVEIDMLEGEDSWETMFSVNTKRDMKILPFERGRCSYCCYGRIESICSVIADCGDLQFDLGNFTHDERVVGEYIYFVIDRMDIKRSIRV